MDKKAKKIYYLLLLTITCTNIPDEINSQEIEFDSLSITLEERIFDINVAKDFFIVSSRKDTSRETSFYGYNFEGELIWERVFKSDEYGAVKTSSYSNFFLLTDFSKSNYSDDDFSVSTIGYDVMDQSSNKLGSFVHTGKIEPLLKNEIIYFSEYPTYLQQWNSDFRNELEEEKALFFHSLGDSLFLTINFRFKSIGKLGFDQTLEKHRILREKLNDQGRVFALDFEEKKRSKNYTRAQLKELSDEFRSNFEKERKLLTDLVIRERAEYDIRDIPISNIQLTDLINSEIKFIKEYELTQEERFPINHREFYPTEIPAAISEDFIATLSNLNNRYHSFSVFDSFGERIFSKGVNGYIRDLRIIENKLLFVLTNSNIYTFDLQTKNQLTNTQISGFDRVRILNRNSDSLDKYFFLVSKEVVQNVYDSYLITFDLNTKEFSKGYLIDKNGRGITRIKEIKNGLVILNKENSLTILRYK